MRDQPDGAALLEAARELLKGPLLAALPAEHRHGALMVANAMAIAERQLRAGDAPLQAELAGLRALPGLADGTEGQAGTDDEDVDALLRDLNHALCQRIRAGDADPGEPLHHPLLQHLRRVARTRVGESNPKVLG